ncbi:MAG TPA: glycerophosphodiester phosphodiesterase family protein, partial [Pseudobdellovibrionaceae bacterium]|nr:glycerophosphodiester phosphodiesterase family protein [Pseudobdellovibrionaceae bacterium]
PTQPQFYPSREIYAGLVLKAVRASGWDPSRIMLQSFDIGILETLRAQGADYRMSPLLSDAKDGIATARRLRADTVTPHYGQVNSEMVRQFHEAGLRIVPWTVNDVEEAKRLIDLGVDGIATDRLDLFLFAKNFCARK